MSLDPERFAAAPQQQPPRPIQREDPEPSPSPPPPPPMSEPAEPPVMPAADSAEPSTSPTPAFTELSADPPPAPLTADPAADPSEERPPSEPVSTADTLALPPTSAEASGPPPQSAAPAVPQGPLVPFAAPPAERDPTTLAMRLVFGILGGVILVVAVFVALIVALVQLSESVIEGIEGTVESFMTDVAAEDWDGAYEQLCADMRESGEVDDYSRSWSRWDTEEWHVRAPRDTFEGTFVPVELGDGSVIELTVVAEGDLAGLAVCGWRSVS